VVVSAGAGEGGVDAKGTRAVADSKGISWTWRDVEREVEIAEQVEQDTDTTNLQKPQHS
jgi:hypothetical protein